VKINPFCCSLVKARETTSRTEPIRLAICWFVNKRSKAISGSSWRRDGSPSYGHAIGIVCGYRSLLLCGLTHARAAIMVGVDGARILAAALSLASTATDSDLAQDLGIKYIGGGRISDDDAASNAINQFIKQGCPSNFRYAPGVGQ
jgi:hypothetical protein